MDPPEGALSAEMSRFGPGSDIPNRVKDAALCKMHAGAVCQPGKIGNLMKKAGCGGKGWERQRQVECNVFHDYFTKATKKGVRRSKQ